MAYITFHKPDGTSYSPQAENFPPMSVGSGGLDYEKIFAFAKRKLNGSMLLRGYKGSVMKITGKWSLLRRTDFDKICKFFSDYTEFYIRVHNPRSGEKEAIKMYSGNIHAEPLFVDKATGLPRYYQNCTVNFITVGLV